MLFFSLANPMFSFSNFIFLNYNFLGGLLPENDNFINALFTFGLNFMFYSGIFLKSFLFSGPADDSLLYKSLELDTDDRLDFTRSILYSKISFLGINLKLLASTLNLLIEELLSACLSYSLSKSLHDIVDLTYVSFLAINKLSFWSYLSLEVDPLAEVTVKLFFASIIWLLLVFIYLLNSLVLLWSLS